MPVPDSQDYSGAPGSPQGHRGANRKHRPRRPRWRKWAWILLALGFLAFLVNGPVFRWGIESALTRALGKAGLTGELTVMGTLLQGPVLSDALFTGPTRLREFSFARARVEYSLGAALKRDWPALLETITLENARLLLDPSRPPPPKRVPKASRQGKPFDPWSLTAYRNVRVELNALTLEVLDASGTDAAGWKADDAAFSLADGGSGTLTVGALALPKGRRFADLKATLRIDEDRLTLAGPDLGEPLAVESLTLAKPARPDSGAFRLDARLRAFGGTLEAAHLHGSSILAARLTDGTLDLARAASHFGLEGLDSATLEAMDATVTLPPHPEEGSKRALPAIDGTVRVTNIRGEGIPLAIASATTVVRLADQKLTLENLLVEAEGNRLTGSLAARLPRKGAGARGWLEALDASLALAAPEATRLLAAFSVPVDAKATATLDLTFTEGILAALSGTAEVTELALGEARADSLRCTLALAAPGVVRADLAARLDPEERNTAHLGGTFALDSRAYAAELSLSLAALENLQPAAAEFGARDLTLEGEAQFEWQGSGHLDQSRDPDHRGSVALGPSTFRINGADPVTAHFDAKYEPDSIRIEPFAATLGELAFEGALAWEQSLLALTGWRIHHGETELARAEASIPFAKDALRSAEALFAQDGPLRLSLDSTDLPLDEIFRALDRESKARGSLTASINVTGTFANPAFAGTVDLERLAIEGLDALKSGHLHLGLAIAEGRADLEGTLTHPDLEPIAIRARAPFAPREWIEAPESMRSAAIEAELSLPDNPLAVLQPFLPDATTVEGHFSALATIDGTLARPEITGSLKIASSLIAFREQELPTIRAIDVDLRFAEQVLSIKALGAEVAGGPVTVGGLIGLADPRNPTLDLTVAARQVLVARDNDLSVRANADLTLAGPSQEARLSGRIGITESRYFRDIEILPVGLLRPAAAPAARRVSFTPRAEPSISAEPFSSWELDVTVGTDTPFLIRGNRAQADIEGEVHLTGTGAAPVPEGMFRITEGEAVLPFSTLGLRESSVTFSPATGFLGAQLNIVGVSEIRSHRVVLRVYGTAANPQYLLTSDPPLPQEDILSLIATGTTRSELSDSNVLASKAAVLLLDELGKKIKDLTGNDAPELPLADRLNIEIAGTDPRTGQTATTTTFKLTDKVHLVGAVDPSGNYRGLLKFIIRLE